ncbi:hypothetical protein [Paenibacillus lautus]|uniref:hypothetical protein n=1 Tax=Paenibacillus lautus TaxID=1401 RepID=UPI0013E2A5E7|nr:hypothetical protein [Paenibacillus lautus]
MVNALLWVSTKQRSGRIDSGKAAAVAFAIGFLQWINTIRKIRGQQRLEERYVRAASFNGKQ